ncbi:MAG: branched-chain amino acid transport system substrate-binding protein [Actinomycetota bacterium]|nr:branched-chain amino acid transport system substrate-binding protein [Actinomycetota bacterium]
MTRRSVPSPLAVLLCALMLVTVACSSSKKSSTATTTTTGKSAQPSSVADGTLTIGTLLPETGSLAFLGPGEFAGVGVAIQEINAAGGVLGKNIEVVNGDSGDASTDIGKRTVDRLLKAHVDAIVGSSSSAVTLGVIDQVTSAGVVMVSPADRAKRLTDYPDHGLYFRTAPSDALQAQVLGQIITSDGNHRVGILAVADPYGEGMAADIGATVTEAGGNVVASKTYDTHAQAFDSEVQAMVDAKPDAVVVVGYDETGAILDTMIAKGIGPKAIKVYGTDANMGDAVGAHFAGSPGALQGMKGTTPLADLKDDFKAKLLEVDPKLANFNFAAESYDAVVLVALAAIAAKSDAGSAIAKAMIDVSKVGTKCTTFEACAALLRSGTDIDYDGVSGPVDFTGSGDPAKASFGILQFDGTNTLQTLEYRLGGA